jgi:hypothetical protein
VVLPVRRPVGRVQRTCGLQRHDADALPAQLIEHRAKRVTARASYARLGRRGAGVRDKARPPPGSYIAPLRSRSLQMPIEAAVRALSGGDPAGLDRRVQLVVVAFVLLCVGR